MENNENFFKYDQNGRRLYSLSDKRENALLKGKYLAQQKRYELKDLAVLLESNDILQTFEAFGALREIQASKFIGQLKKMALYDEDHSIQEGAIITIHSIGGEEAMSVLKDLQKTEHKDFLKRWLSFR